uniref:AT-hook motif nuclear-localized protein 27-like n=1 Tax=Erigeron canadensis TaxID=72917 RepID=UPI001CB9D353|nr:AT-hook motif nuclear-localized protein 27-like [Erigeron canadensis]
MSDNYHHHHTPTTFTPSSPDDMTTSTHRRARGRPAGSKNKPKPPVIVTRDTPNALSSHVLEVVDGADIIDSLAVFARKRGRGLSVLSGTGAVVDVTLRQPAENNDVTLHGRFEILTISGTVLPPPAPPNASGLSIFLGGGEGQVVGGIPIGPLIASGPVILIAASFGNAVFERLPMDESEEEEGSGQVQPSASQCSGVSSGGGGGGGGGGGVFNTTTTRDNNNGGSDYPFRSDLMGWETNPRTPY